MNLSDVETPVNYETKYIIASMNELEKVSMNEPIKTTNNMNEPMNEGHIKSVKNVDNAQLTEKTNKIHTSKMSRISTVEDKIYAYSDGTNEIILQRKNK